MCTRWPALILISAAALLGCSPDLSVPKDAAIACSQDSDCPDGQSCYQGRCVKAIVNSPPSVRFGAPASEEGRFLTNVTLPFAISDPNGDGELGDRVSVTASFCVGCALSPQDSAWLFAQPCESQSLAGLAAPAGEAAYSFSWRAPSDLPTQQVDTDGDEVADETVLAPARGVLLRLEAVDTGTPPEMAIPAISAALSLGNAPPVAALTRVDGSAGAIAMEFRLSDSFADPADVELEFCETCGAATSVEACPCALWRPAGVSLGQTTALITSETGTLSVVVWDSDDEVTGIGRHSRQRVGLRLRAIDHPAPGVSHYGAWSQAMILPEVRNQTPASIAALEVPKVENRLDRATGTIAVYYRIVDDEYDLIDIRLDYSLDYGTTWHPCAEDADPRSEGLYDLQGAPRLEGVAPGLEHTFLWDTRGTLFAPASMTQLRLTIADDEGNQDSRRLSLGDSVGPTAATPNEHLFVDPVSIPLGSGAYRTLAAADLDADGLIDLVVGSATEVTVFRGKGIGRVGGSDFESGTPIAVDKVLAMLIADVTGTSALDLVLLHDNAGQHEVLVLRGQGDGSFVAQDACPSQLACQVQGSAGRLLLADVDADGTADLVTSGTDETSGGSPVSILLGQRGASQDAAFANTGLSVPEGLTSGLGSSDVAVGDFNRDGRPDLAVASNVSPYGVRFFRAADTEALAFLEEQAAFIASSEGNTSLRAADLNRDGQSDLVMTRIEGTDGIERVCVATSRGAAQSIGESLTLPSPCIATGSGAASALLADINGRGTGDLLMTVQNGSDPQAVVVLPGQQSDAPWAEGVTWLGSPVALAAGASAQRALAVADLDGDGLLDVLGVDGVNSRVTWWRSVRHAGFGAQSFAPPRRLVTESGANVTGVAVVDLDADGILDIAALREDLQQLVLYRGEGRNGVGSGRFPTTRSYEVEDHACALVAGDFDGDGRQDLVVLHEAVEVSADPLVRESALLLWRGADARSAVTEPFSAPERVALPLVPARVVNGQAARRTLAADFDGDGCDELAVLDSTRTDTFPNRVAILDAAPAGGPAPFSLTQTVATGLYSFSIAAGDFDADGVLDLATANYMSDNTVSLLAGHGDGTFAAAVNDLSLSGLGKIAAGDMNADGVGDLVATYYTTESVVGIAAGKGDRSFDDPVPTAAISNSSYPPTLADLDGDGVLDIVWASPDVWAPGGMRSGSVVLRGTATGGLADGNLSAPASLDAGGVARLIEVGDLDSDGVADLILADSAGGALRVVLGRCDLEQGGAVRSLSLGDEGNATAEWMGASARDDSHDRFGGERGAHLTQRLYSETPATSFLSLLRRAPGLSLPTFLVPLSHAYEVDGDRRLTRVAPSSSIEARSNEGRLRVTSRLGRRTGQDPRYVGREGLTLDGSEARGVIVNLPVSRRYVASDVDAPARVRVFARLRDWLRDATSEPFLPVINGRDVYEEVGSFVEIPRDEDADLTTGAGRRFIVDQSESTSWRVRVLTDAGGLYQAFMEPNP